MLPKYESEKIYHRAQHKQAIISWRKTHLLSCRIAAAAKTSAYNAPSILVRIIRAKPIPKREFLRAYPSSSNDIAQSKRDVSIPEIEFGMIAGDVANNNAQKAAIRLLKGCNIKTISKQVIVSNNIPKILVAKKRSMPAYFVPASRRVHNGVVVPKTRSSKL